MCLSWMPTPWGLVNGLHLVHEVGLQGILAQHPKQVVGVQRAAGESVACVHPVAVADHQVGRGGDDVLAGLHVFPDYRYAVAGHFNAATHCGKDGHVGQLGGLRTVRIAAFGLHRGGQDHSGFHEVAVVDHDVRPLGQRVFLSDFLAVDDPQDAGVLGGLQLDLPVYIGEQGSALGHAGLEQFFHPGETDGDVGYVCHAAGVEGAHGELGAGLADALGGNDADSLADFHRLGGCGQPSVALAADTARGIAG